MDRRVQAERQFGLRSNIRAHLDAYNRLQRLHNDQALSNEAELASAREVLFILHQWIDAIKT